MRRGSVNGRLVVVLGASGSIGSSLLRVLARHPMRLRAVARRQRAPTVPGVDLRAVDLTEPGRMAEAVADADVILHLVAHMPAGWRVAEGDPLAERVNVGLVDDLIGAVRPGRSPVVVFTSTAGASGESPYGRQKLAAEKALEDASEAGILRGISLRLPTVYGSAHGHGVVAEMVRRAIAGEPLPLWGNDAGLVERDLLHLDDVTTALLAAIAHADSLAGAHWTIGTDVRVSLADLFATIAEVVSVYTRKAPVPVVTVQPSAVAEPADLRSVRVDSSAFRAITGWAPRVRLRAGLARTVSECFAGTPPVFGPRC